MTDRELDALVAEHVMELGEIRTGMLSGNNYYTNDHGRQCIPRYSTSIASAWEVVENCAPGGIVHIKKHSEVMQNLSGPKGLMYAACVTLDYGNHYKACADTAPKAICLAALKACGVEVDEWN